MARSLRPGLPTTGNIVQVDTPDNLPATARAGLVTLVATTVAGHQAYAALDIPEDEAIALADTAVPDLVTPFLA